MIKTIFIIFFIAASAHANAQPVETVKKYFESKSYEDSRWYVCCSMLDTTTFNREEYDTFNKLYKSYELIYDSTSSALVMVRIDDHLKAELYAYLVTGKEGWRIEDVKIRWLPSFGSYYNYLPDSITQSKEYTDWRERSELMTSSDSAIIKYFNDNKAAFESYLPVMDSLYYNVYSAYPDHDTLIHIKPWLPHLALSAVSKHNFPDLSTYPTGIGAEIFVHERRKHDHPDITFFEILNFSGNSTGYLYSEARVEVKLLDKKKFLVIKEIGDRWYFYKAMLGDNL